MIGGWGGLILARQNYSIFKAVQRPQGFTKRSKPWAPHLPAERSCAQRSRLQSKRQSSEEPRYLLMVLAHGSARAGTNINM